MANALKKLKDIPPGDSEDQGIKEYQNQVNALAAPVATAEPPVEQGPPELIHPLQKYGSRQGEVRYAVDKAGNLTPIAVPQEPAALAPMAPAAAAPVVAPARLKTIVPQSLQQPMPVYDNGGDVNIIGGSNLRKMGTPVYDNGGDVKVATPPPLPAGFTRRAAPVEPPPLPAGFTRQATVQPPPPPEGSRPFTPDEAKYIEDNAPSGGYRVGHPEDMSALNYIPRYGSEAAVAKRPKVGMPKLRMEEDHSMDRDTVLPLYDDGGEVDVNDGKHQVAVLQDGERVLTPEEAEQYKKEKGAPVGFPGMVLPNEKGVQPEWDSEHKPENKQYPGGARMNIDNAKVGEGDQDAQTFPTVMPSEASAKTPLKPHSEVLEEQAKAKAAEMVRNPNPTGQPVAANVEGTIPEGAVQPEEKAKPTLGQGLAQDWLKKIGANPRPEPTLPDNVAPPAAQGQQPAGMKPIVQPEAAPKPLDRKSALQSYDQQIQAALNEATPEGQEKALRLSEAKQELIHRTPWGSSENHPGMLGKLGHVAAQIGSRLPIIGQVVNQIPGSEGARNAEHNATLGELDKATQLTTAREAAEAKEKKASDDKYTLKEVVDTRPDSPTKGQTIYAGVNNTDPTDVRYTPLNAAPKSVAAGGDKAAFEKTLAKTGNPDVADAPKQREAIDGAHASGKINDEEYAQANAYLGATANAPSTQASTEERKEQTKAAKAYYTYTTTGADGKKTTHVTTGNKLDELPEDAQLLPIKDMPGLIGEARSMNAVQDSMNELHKDLHDHPEVFDNGAARTIVQTTTEQMDRASAGLLIAGTGGQIPIPSGFGDSLNTLLQNHALDDKTSRAVKNYIADYKAMKDKAMVIQMAMQNGKMGRGGQQAFTSITQQIPGGSTADSQTAMRQMAAFQRTLNNMMGKYPEEYADFKKLAPYDMEEAAPEGTAAGEAKGKTAPKTKGGYSANNPFAQKATAPTQ